MKELIKSYQQLLTAVETRIAFLTEKMRTPDPEESIKSLRARRDTLKEEYEDLIYALHRMAKYADTPDTTAEGKVVRV
ncbi:hypothetical protein [Ruminococcus sp. NK3A76]|uniref:hypothetical protein n=1 Tax=Ruminococcus sp. NK3A76 TaxID=877411 RepID=UPI00048EB3DA|nr:hypothetical protein [Ruminococcus sp. NK3A76]